MAIWLQRDDLLAVNEDQQSYSQDQDDCGDPELNIRQDGPHCACPATAFITHSHLLLTAIEIT